LKWIVLQENTVAKCSKILNALDRAYYLNAQTKAKAINAAVWPIALYRNLAPLTKTRIEKLMSKARRIIRSALRATNSFPAGLILQDVSQGGINLQDLHLEMAKQRLATISSILNKNGPTGTNAVGRELDHAIGADGNSNHKASNKRLPFEFSPNFVLADETAHYRKYAESCFFYKAIKQSIATIKTISGVDLYISWKGAYRPHIRNILTPEQFNSKEIVRITRVLTAATTPQKSLIDLRYMTYQPNHLQVVEEHMLPEKFLFEKPRVPKISEHLPIGVPHIHTYVALLWNLNENVVNGFNTEAILHLRGMVASESGVIHPKIAGNYTSKN
jgi:hypothetical protein